MWYKFSGKKDIDLITKNNDISKYIIENYPISKFQTTIAFFANQGVDDENLRKLYQNLQVLNNKKNIEIFANQKAVYYNKQKYTNFEALMNQLNVIYNLSLNEKYDPQKDQTIQKILNQPEVSVIKIESSEDACMLGSGSLWCVARPGDSNFLNLKRLGYTFYLVIDNNSKFGEEYHSGEYSRVMITVAKNGSITCYDMTNNSIDTREYLNYLKSIGVDINQFKNSEKYNQKLFENAWNGVTENEYMHMPYKEKLYYNQYSVKGLTNNQLRLLIQNNSKELINAYMKNNTNIPENQLNMLTDQQRSVYEKYRSRNFNQMVNGLKDNPEEIAMHSIAYEDKKLIDYLCDSGLSNYIEEYLYLVDTDSSFGKYVVNKLQAD